jgi:hypothetical protein
MFNIFMQNRPIKFYLFIKNNRLKDQNNQKHHLLDDRRDVDGTCSGIRKFDAVGSIGFLQNVEAALRLKFPVGTTHLLHSKPLPKHSDDQL